MRFAVDTGGTFTDLVLEDDAGALRLFKSPTTPNDPLRGVLDVVGVAAENLEFSAEELLGQGTLFIHGTTRATNAILTGSTARTAFLVTEGHPDILLFREGGRSDPFNWTQPFPEPYVPRALTFQVPERIGSQGEVVAALDEERVVDVTRTLKEEQIEAVAVCFLWAPVNSTHEERVGELLDEHLPGVPYTLSHELNPALREYRRASSTAIDASLKPLMTDYLQGLTSRLEEAGFGGRVLVVTSAGGVLDAGDIARAPIHSLGSGPAMAPVAGRYYSELDGEQESALVADTGGTSFDVSLVRRGRIPFTRETWLGPQFLGHMTGFPSIDVRSIGAGGGSIAWVDSGGLLHVGPQSAGADPGPVCYGQGGTEPTATDAALTLGYVDPDFFLGGTMQLALEPAQEAIAAKVGEPLGLGLEEAAAAMLELATEHMARAIEEITVNQGIDPRTAVLVGGGGAAGLNAVAIARRLGCPLLIIPEVAAVLSAAGALMSDLTSDFGATYPTLTKDFDLEGVNETLAGLVERCEAFIAGPGAGSLDSQIELAAEARYPHQNWEIEVPLRAEQFAADDVEQLRQDFHTRHEEIFAINDPESAVEVVAWRARVRCRLRESESRQVLTQRATHQPPATRRAYFRDAGEVDAAVRLFDSLEPGESLSGPALIESPTTTVVIEPGATVTRSDTGSLTIEPGGVARASSAAVAAQAGEGSS